MDKLMKKLMADGAAEYFDVKPAHVAVTDIAPSGSGREYVRLTDTTSGQTLIGVSGPVKDENKAFIYIARQIHKAGIPAPRIINVAQDKSAYIISDNGRLSLFDIITRARAESADGTLPADVMRMCREAMRLLVRIQLTMGRKLDFSKCYPVSEVTRQAVLWDLNYFKYCFLKPVLDNIDEAALEADFERMSMALTNPGLATGFQYRDFQSRNIMIDDEGRLTPIDFQGGRRGMLLYDVASFIWQAKAGFTDKERKELVDAYHEAFVDHRDGYNISRSELDTQLQLATTFRQLQTLGAYGFRGLIQHKAHFMTSLPIALANLNARVSARELRDYPAIAAAIRAAAQAWNVATDLQRLTPGRLTVTVTSFSFKKGYPVDTSGNGGGFVFDCRGMHNPGRYEEYKHLTALDRPVSDFLHKRGECDTFVANAAKLVGPTVANYLERGFQSLSVAFGCTGGHHRSVYCTEHFAKEIAKAFPEADVRIIHRELLQENRWTPRQ